MEDRRRHQRFMLHDSCFINHSDVVGTIIDISMGGMSCTCLNHKHCHQGCLKRVDIYCRTEGMWVEDLDIRILASEVIPGKIYQDFCVRKCRLQFVHLNQAQEDQLESLILHSVLPTPSTRITDLLPVRPYTH